MNFRYPHPDNEKSFEKFCLKLLQRHWNNPHLELYGRRGEGQAGVDIIDPTFSAPFKAAQCKHHEPLITIPPSEIEQEVSAALTFTPPLDHYAIVTSGRATTHAQNKIIEINRSHRAKGLFIVELLWWEKIEDLLDDYPDVADLLTKITNARLSQFEDKVNQGFRGVTAQIELVVATTGRTAIDAEIDESESCLKNSDPQSARILLEKLRQRHWEELTSQQKYRIKIGFSNAALLEGKDRESGRLLLEAKDLCPDSERAQINEAVGLELIGSREKAHARATELIQSYPSSGKLVACLIRTAPSDSSLEDIMGYASPAVRGDAEVCTALALRAMSVNKFSDAESYARTAVTASPEWFGPNFLLGQALLNGESIKLQRTFRAGPAPIDEHRLVQSIAAIDEAIRLAKKSQAMHCLSDCYLIRALANVLRCEDQSAVSDFDESTRTGPVNTSARYHYAFYLFNQGRIDEAIIQIRKSVNVRCTCEMETFLASMLSERDGPGDRSEAAEIYARVASTDDDVLESQGPKTNSNKLKSHRSAAFHSAIDEYVELGRLHDAEVLLGGVPPERFSRVAILTASSKVRLAQGDFAAASAIADEALTCISESSDDLDTRSLALQFGRLERHKDALPLWLRINESAGYSNDVRHLVRCAERVKRYDVILSVAKAARETGILDTWLLYKEVEVLETFDFEGAITLLRERLRTHSEDKLARIRLSQIGLKWQRPELVDSRPEMLPSVEEVTPSQGAVSVEILRQFGKPDDALRYAYQLVRRFFNEPDANAALVMVFFSPNSTPLTLVDPTEAGAGTAVCYAEGDNNRWIVIEDSPDPRPELSEYAPDHPLAQSLKGKRVAETVVLSKTSARNRTAVIKEIKSKYVFRMHEIVENWQIRFPDQPFVQLYRVTAPHPTTGQEVPDFTDLKLLADRRHERISEAENLYKTQVIPLHLLSKAAGCDPFRSLFYVASKDDLPVRCTRGQPSEQTAALEALGSCNTLVLDITAIATVSLFELADLLEKWRGKIVISQSTATELRSTLENLTSEGKSGGYFGKTDRGYFFLPSSAESMKVEAESFRSFVDTLFGVCEIRACPQLADLDPVIREQLVHAFGQHGVESMLIARVPGHVLWTDDIAVSDIASAEFSVRRVWTQAVLEHAAGQGLLVADDYLATTAKLLAFDYEATAFNPLVLAKAGSMSNWNPERWPLTKALEQFVNSTIQPDQVIVQAAAVIGIMYKEAPLVEARQATLIKILERLQARPNGLDEARVLISMLPTLFGINVLAAEEAASIGRAWLAEARRRRRVEIPRQPTRLSLPG
jgi:tetratricopeptide (TPR) repeat protein